MRFIIQEYLEQLREREELDAILPDLLRAMGFQIVKLAFRGEVEHGVDIAAYKTEGKKGTLYLFQVKPGDIDQRLWDVGQNSIRTTLNNLLDVPFQDLTQPRLKNALKKVVLVHNGTLRENIRERFNGYIDNVFESRMSFDRWDVDRLSTLLEENLLNEKILPKQYQNLLRRTLIFINTPDYDLVDFKQLLEIILPDTKKMASQKRRRIFGFIRLILAMVYKQCQEHENLSPAINAYEYALLRIWGWMYTNNFLTKHFTEDFQHTYSQYFRILVSWAYKLSPALYIRDGLGFVGSEEVVEYPLRTFKIIGNLGLLIIFLTRLPESELKNNLLPKTVDLLINTIQNNPARHRPLLDNHSIDIFLGIWALVLMKQNNFAKWWLQDIFEHLAIRWKFHKRLPELYNNIDAVIEYEASDERPVGYVDSSSTLIYMLFEFCILINARDIYDFYRPVFDGINLQIWYPPENVEKVLYFREVHEGDTEIIHKLPEDFEEFYRDVQARHTFDRNNYTPDKEGFPEILLLANKYFRTPVFSFWWRRSIFPKQTNGTDRRMPKLTWSP